MKENPLQSDWLYNLQAASILLRKEHQKVLKPLGLTREQWQTLAILEANEPLTQKEICSVTLQDAPTASRMMLRMEENGLIKRKVDAEDRRAARVQLTAKASKLLNTAQEKLQNHFNLLFKGITAKEKKELQNLVKKVSETIDAG